MLLGIHCRIRNLRPLHERGIVHLTQVEAAFEQTDDMLINLSLREQTSLHSLRDALIGIVEATLHFGTRNDSL